jgi:WS/DGAT/MGAT family acyltransferase
MDALRTLGTALRRPEKALAESGRAAGGLAAMAAAGLAGAPPSPLNVRIGPHRRFAWVDADLDRFKAIKSSLGGTVNDVVLAVVTGALRAFVIGRGRDVDGLELKAMVPVSVRAETERGALGNRVAAMYAPLPVHAADPLDRFRIVHEAMAGLKESGQAVGAEVITRLAGFAAPTVLDQAARLQARQRFFNVTVTNVPGPQFPLYLQGRRLRAFYPQVPLTLNTALGIAIMSYDGHLFFGLLGDYDALPELDDVAAALERSVEELATAAGVGGDASGRRRPARRRQAATK